MPTTVLKCQRLMSWKLDSEFSFIINWTFYFFKFNLYSSRKNPVETKNFKIVGMLYLYVAAEFKSTSSNSLSEKRVTIPLKPLLFSSRVSFQDAAVKNQRYMTEVVSDLKWSFCKNVLMNSLSVFKRLVTPSCIAIAGEAYNAVQPLNPNWSSPSSLLQTNEGNYENPNTSWLFVANLDFSV